VSPKPKAAERFFQAGSLSFTASASSEVVPSSSTFRMNAFWSILSSSPKAVSATLSSRRSAMRSAALVTLPMFSSK